MSNFISSEHSEKLILRYDLLFEEGIKFAQKYSGITWTDYNYHDPGVTFLEYLCYSITDLGYRSNFPIEDLFLFGKDDFDSIKKNLLFGPATIFNTSPITINDYRKLIIDKVKEVANAWVIPVSASKIGVSGLFEIFLQSSEDLSEFELKYLKQEVEQVFHSNRLIGHDLSEVIVLQKVNLSIKADILIESDALGELVMAKVYANLDNYINPQVERHNPERLWKEEGYKPEEVFTGPLPKYGYIFENDLSPKVEVIYLSKIKELILSVTGVKEIKKLQLFKNEIPVFDNFVFFEKSEFPKIQYLNDLTDTFQTEIRLLKNGVEYEVDPIITKQLITSENLSVGQFYHEELTYKEILPQGRFSLDDLKKHFPIHNELPEFYGLGKRGASGNYSDTAQSSILQLAAYLFFFEQFIASYLAQLANLRNLFSADFSKVTYFNQVPTDIPNLEFLIDELEGFKAKLDQCSSFYDYSTDRHNRLLNHLLARFGEVVDDSSLKKINRGNSIEIEGEIYSELIATKTNLLHSIVELGKDRAKGTNIKSDEIWDTTNVSGLEKRLCLSLNIQNYARRNLSASLLRQFQSKQKKVKKSNWELITIVTEREKLEVFKLPSEEYSGQAVHFYGTGIHFIRELFDLVSNEKSLWYVTSKNKSSHYLIIKQRQSEYPFVAYEAETEVDCLKAKQNILKKFRDLEKDSEGFHLVEHVLLRPLEPISFLFSFLDTEGEAFIEGVYPGDLKKQKSLGEEAVVYGISEDNYSILKEHDSPVYTVVLYDLEHEPMARLKRNFNSKPKAKEGIQSAIAFFRKLANKELGLEAVMDVVHIGGMANGFPADFQFSSSLSLIFPDWPSRFQKPDFLKFIKRILAENILAHHSIHIYFLNITELARFEELFHKWLIFKRQKNQDLKMIDNLSLQIIQMLKGFKSAS